MSEDDAEFQGFFAGKQFEKLFNEKSVKAINRKREIAHLKDLSETEEKDFFCNYEDHIKTDEEYDYLLMTMCNAGTLMKLREMRKLSMKEIQFIMREVIKALKVQRQKGIMHRDMKVNNVMLHFPWLEEENEIE